MQVIESKFMRFQLISQYFTTKNNHCVSQSKKIKISFDRFCY